MVIQSVFPGCLLRAKSSAKCIIWHSGEDKIQQLCLPDSRQELQVGSGTDRKAARGCICGLRRCPGKIQLGHFLWCYRCMPGRSTPLEPSPAGLGMVLTSSRRCLDDVPARPPVSSQTLRPSPVATDGRKQRRSLGPLNTSPETGSRQYLRPSQGPV